MCVRKLMGHSYVHNAVRVSDPFFFHTTMFSQT